MPLDPATPARTRPTALVTGASAGIGREFARQLAARRHDLVLVARDVARLEELAGELRRDHGVDVEVLAADLSDRDALQRVADRLADPSRPVDLLVNNAGYGLKGRFLRNPVAVEEAAFDVLTRAVLVLSHAGATGMVERGHGAVVNVSSVAGYVASGTYSAAKSWVTVFTEGLSTELAGTGVTATALCPGFTNTEFQQRAGIAKPGPGFIWLDAPDLVSTCLADVAKGRVVSVPGWQYKTAVGLLKVLPRPLLRRGLRPQGPGGRARRRR
ncbi:SDR family NAD(P)-dependent oxidoreductase [Terrabacter terrigena]|uniref:SDR family NAD(P)-dependent oxidoreductase n=1 Tax=Terrabacter terrigena TaxID=574718 RepID=A0ABW3MU77_9MICO